MTPMYPSLAVELGFLHFDAPSVRMALHEGQLRVLAKLLE